MKIPTNLNYKKVAVISVCCLVFGILNSYVIFPKILKFMLKRNLQLKPGSQMRPMFDKIPFPLDFKIYLFNITNPDDVLLGKKPHVQEIGPYCFDEWKEKHDMEEFDEDDTIEFTLQNKFIFSPERSNGLTGNEVINVPHLIIFGALNSVKRDRAPMLPLVSKAMKILFQPKTPFLTVKVMDILFNGVDINCDVHDFSAKAVCTSLEGETQGINKVNDTFFQFSVFGTKNGTDAGRFRVYRGIKNIRDLGRIAKFNDETEIDTWDGDECNRIIGTDSTIFPPFLKKDEGLWAFTPDICRSMGAYYVGKSKYAGLPTSRYTLDFGDLKNQPELQCFCNDPPHDCPPKGVMDLFPCVGAPLFGSKPHFLDSDPMLLEMVDGLNPDASKHDIAIDFELISGTPLSGAKRLQFSIELQPIEEFDLLHNVTKAMLPILWVEEGVQLNKTYTNLLKYQLFLALKFNSVMKWMSILGGLIGIGLSSFMIHKQMKDEQGTKVTAVVESQSNATSANSTSTRFQDNLKETSDKNTTILGLGTSSKEEPSLNTVDSTTSSPHHRF